MVKITLGIVCGLLLATAGQSAVLTVAKNGASANFTSIQAAVDKAGPGDEIIVIDTAVYEEQVTIDSTKSGLVLRSEHPAAKVKPTIRFRDIVNVGPRNIAESKDPKMITYDKNGTVRVIKAGQVRVEGFVIDGGGVLPFGYSSVWESGGQTWPLQHGNAAVCINASGNTIIRYCQMQNAYFGMYINDRNRNGVFSTQFATDGTETAGDFTMPLSTGNHLIEKNRIHDNSFGIFFETINDMGSTLRYNLIYENHHRGEELAVLVRDLTSEGGNHPGGAIMFKNQILCPLAIHNNTFWNNHMIFIGAWKAGGQHLVFSNIFSKPEVYHSESSYMDMFKCFTNRMLNNVFAAQTQMPVANQDIRITNEIVVEKEGDVIAKPFTVSAENRSLETKFISTDPASVNFLEPDWNDSLVKLYVKDKGWAVPGIQDDDGSLPDIGAISQGNALEKGVVMLQPAAPVSIVDGKAIMSFYVNSLNGKLTDAKATLYELVRNLDTSDIFGNQYKPIAAADIITIPLVSAEVTPGGKNTLEAPLSILQGNYAFYEIVITGSVSGNQVCSGVGFMPYRKNELTVKVDLLDSLQQTVVKNVVAGRQYVLRVSVIDDVAGKVEEKTAFQTRIVSASGSVLSTPDGKVLTSLGIIKGVAEFNVTFAGSTQGAVEHLSIAIFNENLLYAGCVGTSQDLIIGEGTPVMELPRYIPEHLTFGPGHYEITDLSGRIVYRGNAASPSLQDLERQVRSSLTHGVYLIKFYNGKGRQVIMQKKIVAGR